MVKRYTVQVSFEPHGGWDVCKDGKPIGDTYRMAHLAQAYADYMNGRDDGE